MNWWDEWDSLGPELERINMATPSSLGNGGCVRCNSWAADNQAMEQQHRLAIIGYEEVITHLRERIAQLELNRDLRMDRPQGWDTGRIGE